MAHYAFLNLKNIVTEVIAGVEETEFIEGLDPETWYGNLRNQKCVRTSYNGNIRYNYAGFGYTYDELADAFISPKPDCNHTTLFLNDSKRWECADCETSSMQSRTAT